MTQSRTLLYSFLKPWVRLGARLFFKRIEIDNIKNLPTDRPVVLVANHQNAMLDPVITCLYSSKQLHWLTRADVFLKPAVNRLLRKLNMLPVYRERDRVSDLAERNQKTFNECYNRMKHNAVICIFPEGTHRGKKQLVPLKKGASRLVTGAIDAGVKNVCVVPVGLDYENYYQYRRNLLVRFGQPINIDVSMLPEGNDRAKFQAKLTEDIRLALSNVMINIGNDEIYKEIIFLKPFCDKLNSHSILGKQFDVFKKLTLQLDHENGDHQFLNHEVRELMSTYHRLRISEELFEEKFNSLLALLLVVTFPLVVIPAIVFYPIYFATEKFVSAVVKDPLFQNSIRLVFWTFLVPIWLTVIFVGLTISPLSALMSTAFIAFVIVTGVFSLYWWQGWKKWKHHLHCRKIENNDPDNWKKMIDLRTRVVAWLNAQVGKQTSAKS